MSFTKSFPTYNGFCHVLIDKIILSTSENPNNAVDHSFNKHNNLKILVSSIVFALFIAGAIVGLFFKDEILWGSYSLVIAILSLIYFYSFNIVSKTNIIQKAAITKVQFNPSIYPTQQAHFVISFKGENLINQKRIIYLTGNFAKTSDATIQQAILVMEEEFG